MKGEGYMSIYNSDAYTRIRMYVHDMHGHMQYINTYNVISFI